MIGRSNRVRKMTEYHRFADKTDRAHKTLSAKTKSFITHVEACLPPGREEWWKAFSEKDSGPEDDGPEATRDESKEALIEALMFESRPCSEALRCARRLDKPWKTDRAERSIKSSDSRLKFRAGQVLKWREKYVNLLLEEDRIRRKGDWDWYETVRTVRNAAWKSDLCPLVQINQLQAIFQKDVQVEAGFPEVEADSLGEAAMKSLATQNQRIGYPNGSSRKRWKDLPFEESKIEDAIWTLYLSIASGDRVPGAPLDTGSKWTAPSNGTCVLRN